MTHTENTQKLCKMPFKHFNNDKHKGLRVRHWLIYSTLCTYAIQMQSTWTLINAVIFHEGIFKVTSVCLYCDNGTTLSADLTTPTTFDALTFQPPNLVACSSGHSVWPDFGGFGLEYFFGIGGFNFCLYIYCIGQEEEREHDISWQRHPQRKWVWGTL